MRKCKCYFCTAINKITMNLIAELQERNLVQDIMPGTEEQLLKEMTAGYIGFDPTADSLHVGSLLPITLLMRLQRAGHKPYALVGGATGMIGDPSGKSQERNLLDMETIESNCAGIKKQLEKFLDFNADAPNGAVMVNNYDWFRGISFLDFIRDAGKHISVNYMLAKDSVQKTPGDRYVFHRVYLPADTGIRLLLFMPQPQRAPANGRGRPVGQYCDRHGADTQEGRC